MPTIVEDFHGNRIKGSDASGDKNGAKNLPRPVQSLKDARTTRTAIKKSQTHDGSRTSWNIGDESELELNFPSRRFNLFVGTWNMQRCRVPHNVDDFILARELVCDVIVIGIQEAPSDVKSWEIRLQETLGPNHALAHSTSHGVLHISVFVKRHLIWHCSDFVECKITTRPISQIKTKGAVGISFSFFGSRFLFLNSHFHSGQTKTNERIEDYRKITSELKISSDKPHKMNGLSSKFDGVFWFGDLNFRISQPHQHLKDEIANATYDIGEMLKCDQLTRNMKRGKLFRDFQEAKINFLPTYKFAANSDNYDTSKKFRVPSYTDRILYRPGEPDCITFMAYNSVPELRNSDHRPVYGIFSVKAKPNTNNTAHSRVSGDFGGKFNQRVYSKAAGLRAKNSNITAAATTTASTTSSSGKQNASSMVCNIL